MPRRPWANVTPELRALVYHLADMKVTQDEIARRFDISQTTVWRILKRRKPVTNVTKLKGN